MKSLVLYIFGVLFCFNFIEAQQSDIPVDSIYILRDLSRDAENYSMDERLLFAKRSLELAQRTGVDSTIIWSNIRVGNLHFLIDEKVFFKKYRESLEVSDKIKDNYSRQAILSDLGIGYKYYGQIDSAYYFLNKALKYNSFSPDDHKHDPFLSLASLQLDFKFYLKSEQNLITALEFLYKAEPDKEILIDRFNAYNLLGLLSTEQDNFSDAQDYFIKAYEVAEEMQLNRYTAGDINKLIVINNIGAIYEEQEQYDKAIQNYEKALSESDVLKDDPYFYPLLQLNLAYAKFLKGDRNIDDLFTTIDQANKYNNTLVDTYEKKSNFILASSVSSMIYFSEKQKDSAIKYAQQTYNLSKELSHNEYVLESLLLLSELKDGEAGAKHLREYIHLSDSIVSEERMMRNKFARIEYESDQLESDNLQLIEERQWLYSVIIGLFGLSLLIVIILVQRSKNRRLKFSKAQENANEDIYSLILSQQTKIDEGRQQERQRVSEELHDGVLNKLYGARLGLSLLSLRGEDEDVSKFNKYLEEINTIESEVSDLAQNLKLNDLNTEGDFGSMLKKLLQKQTKYHEIQYELKHIERIDWTKVDAKHKVNLYRIIQEATHNTVKHAEASTIMLSFDSTESELELVISDDGKGFSPKKVRKGIGLKNIRSRIKKLNGTFRLDSQPNTGTTIQMSIPL